MRALREQAKHHAESKLRSYGGDVKDTKKHPDAKEDVELLHKELKPSAFKVHKADGGPIGAMGAKSALGRGRKGASKDAKGTHVNIILASKPDMTAPGVGPAVQSPNGNLPPMPMPPRPMPHAMPPVGNSVSGPVAMGPGSAGPMNRGGKVKHRKSGGHVYDAGAGSGEGRLEKIKEYGKKVSRS